MKINGDLEVLGTTNLKILEDNIPQFSSDDTGKLLLNNNKLFVNNGEDFISLMDNKDIEALSDSLGSIVITSLAFNPSAFSNFDNVSSLTGNSSLFDVLAQLDASIPKTFSGDFQTATNSHTVQHNLDVNIAHVTVVDRNTNIKVKDSEMTISFIDNQRIQVDLNSAKAVRVFMSAL